MRLLWLAFLGLVFVLYGCQTDDIDSQTVIAQARDTGDISLCEQLDIEEDVAQCYYTIGTTHDDAQACTRIAEVAEGLTHNYLSEKSCLIDVAMDTGDPNVCSQHGDTREAVACAMEAAKSSNNPLYCEILNDENMHDDCIRMISQDIQKTAPPQNANASDA